MTFAEYKEKAKALGGTLRIKNMSIGSVVYVITDDGTNISKGNCFTKEFLDKYQKFFALKNKMSSDKEFKRVYIC